jgi:hypothetical protein
VCLWKWWDINIVLDETPQEEPPQNYYIAQIPGHTNYAWLVRQPFPSITGLHFSREMAVVTIGKGEVVLLQA